MSDYVTWEVCTRCGLLAAVGWVNASGVDSAPRRLYPVEFDCPTGCQPDLDELVRAYGLPTDRTPPDRAEERGQ